MKKVAFHIEKGGTGKTTLAGNISWEMRFYARTAMVDCDPQGNLSSWFLTEPIQYELADVLLGDAETGQTAIEVREGLYLLPTFGIDGRLDQFKDSQTVMNHPYAFQDFIASLEELGIEIAIFDLSPGMSNLEKMVLSAMDEVIGVSAAEYFSFDGLEIYENELEKLRQRHRAQFIANKLVINRMNRSYSLHKAYEEQFNTLTYDLFRIGQSTGISDCVPAHQSLFEFDPGNRNGSELQRLALAIAKEEVPA
jgi:cellulose biosynthesis protein BcsQ